MVIKVEDRGAAEAVREELDGLFRGNGGKVGRARAQSRLMSQVINLYLQQGYHVERREQLELN